MKKLIVTACAAIASAVALASTVESSNVFGVLKVAGSDGTNIKDFIIPVPWEAVGGGNIDPTKLVLASALEDDGALLFEYGNGQSGKFGAWGIEGGAWKPANVNDKNLSAENFVTATADTTIGRGYALVLRTKSENIYLSGQYADTASSVTIIPATQSGSAITPSYTLIGGNFASNVDLNSDVTFYSGESVVKPNAKDEIRLSLSEVYTRNLGNTLWQKKTDAFEPVTIGSETREIPIYSTVGVTIPAGCGAWYVRKGTDELTMTFSGVSE